MSAVDTVSRTEDIEVGCDLAFERRWWRIQRIGWFILVLLLIGGVVGLFGHGPLSKATLNVPGSDLRICYQRLARRETPTALELRLGKTALASGQLRLRLNQTLVEKMQLKQIVPAPLKAEPLADGVRFIFQTDPSRDSALVYFAENPTTPGFVDAEIAIDDEAPVHFRQFIYP
jgi:hypothetical protein